MQMQKNFHGNEHMYFWIPSFGFLHLQSGSHMRYQALLSSSRSIELSALAADL